MSRSAFCLGIDVNDLTKPILTEEQIERERNTHYMRDKTKIEWSVYDEETAPLLENTLRDIYEGKTNEQGRPERVSERMVYRIIRTEYFNKICFRIAFNKSTHKGSGEHIALACIADTIFKRFTALNKRH